MQSGGSSAKTLKKLKGAALTVPVGPTVVTQAIGPRQDEGGQDLVAVVMIHVGDGVLHGVLVAGGAPLQWRDLFCLS